MTETTLPEQDCDQSEFVDLSIGWAAVRRGAVVAFIPMRNFQDVDFERFREESRWLLATLGSVKAQPHAQTGWLHRVPGPPGP